MTKKTNTSKDKFWWHETGINFECIACGKCCGGEPGFIWVNDKEIKLISEFLAISEDEFRKTYLVKVMGKYSIKEQKNYDCIFLDKESRKCKIYKVRPDQCSRYPFWNSLLEDKKLWNYYSKKCPGMDKGKHYSDEVIANIYSTSEESEEL